MTDTNAASPIPSSPSTTTKEEPLYVGRREVNHRCVVTRAGKPLEPRLDLWNHSPGGFEWGYWGSGPAQLALAILADHLGDDERAVRLHQDFKRVVVAMLPRESWALTAGQVAQAVAAIEASFGPGVP
jgi:hypothetical protein